MVFGTGAGHVFEAWQLHFAARFRGWKAATFGFVQIFNGQLHTSKGVAKLQTMTAGAGVPNHLERMIRLMNSHSTHCTKFRNRTSNNIDRSLSSSSGVGDTGRFLIRLPTSARIYAVFCP